MLGRAAQRPRDPLALVLGVLLIVLVVLAVQAALGLVFDPRYRDFPFAPLTGAVVPLLLHRARATRLRAPTAGGRDRRRGDARARGDLHRLQRDASPTGRRCGSAPGCWRSRVTLLRVRDAPG